MAGKLLRYRHIFYLQMLAGNHIKHTDFINLNRISETDVAFTHKTIQKPEQWFLFVVSDKKSAAQVSLVFVKQKDYSYILNQQALQTQQITHIARYS